MLPPTSSSPHGVVTHCTLMCSKSVIQVHAHFGTFSVVQYVHSTVVTTGTWKLNACWSLMACSSVIRTLGAQIWRSVRFDPEQPLSFLLFLLTLISCFRH